MQHNKKVTFFSQEDFAEAINRAEAVYLLSIEQANGTIGRRSQFIAAHIFEHQAAQVERS